MAVPGRRHRHRFPQRLRLVLSGLCSALLGRRGLRGMGRTRRSSASDRLADLRWGPRNRRAIAASPIRQPREAPGKDRPLARDLQFQAGRGRGRCHSCRSRKAAQRRFSLAKPVKLRALPRKRNGIGEITGFPPAILDARPRLASFERPGMPEPHTAGPFAVRPASDLADPALSFPCGMRRPAFRSEFAPAGENFPSFRPGGISILQTDLRTRNARADAGGQSGTVKD